MRMVRTSSTMLIAVLFHTFFLSASAAVFQHVTELPTSSYDFIIVGGGTAGGVVANRLSENPTFRVLVIEAGPTNEGVLAAIVPKFYSALQKTTYDWNYTTTPTASLNNRSLNYPKGRILGGCSSHNGMFYTRGSKDDYNRWAKVTGDSGWAWNNIFPYFLKNEKWTLPSDHHDIQGDFDPSLHGSNGLIFTSLPSHPQTIDEMVLNVTKELPDIFPFLTDLNSGRPLGLGWLQGTMGNGTRSSSATAYLSSKFTSRANLDVLLNTKVTRVLSSGKGATVKFNHVELEGSSDGLTSRKEIIMSAGTVNTPQILLNSGIGDRDELQKLNITSVLHLPSVGKNLTDQPLITMIFYVNSTNPVDDINTNATTQAQALAQWQLDRTGPDADLSANFVAWSRLSADSPPIQQFGDSSAGPNTPHIEAFPMSALTVPGQPGHYGTMEVVIVSPRSRGAITLNPVDPYGSPNIDPGLLTDEFDVLALVEAIKLGQQFYSAPTWANYALAQLSPPPTATDAELVEFIHSTAESGAHNAGTAAMSAKGASYGVVDPDLRVKGASGLRIVDASVMPFVTSGHTQAPVYVIAERASDLIKGLWA